MEETVRMKNPGRWVKALMNDFIERSPENTLGNRENEKAWEDYLLGFSSGGDPLYQEYKEYVGHFHWTPLEIFRITFTSSEVSAEDLTVISWVLPQSKATKSDNRKEKIYPSERWAKARIFGEEGNIQLAKHMVANLQQAGFRAVAPSLLSPSFKWRESERYTIVS